MDYREMGALLLTSLLEDLVESGKKGYPSSNLSSRQPSRGWNPGMPIPEMLPAAALAAASFSSRSIVACEGKQMAPFPPPLWGNVNRGLINCLWINRRCPVLVGISDHFGLLILGQH